jgi:hypothetical protein
MRFVKVSAIIFGLLAFNSHGADVNNALGKRVLAVYQSYLKGMQEKNLATVISTLHPESPSFKQAKASAAQTMINFELSYKLTGYSFVGKTGEYAVIRIKQQTRKISGAGKFQDNELDALQIFKLDTDGKWKLWSSSVLAVAPIAK